MDHPVDDVSLSERIERAARIAHEVNRAYCSAIGDDSQPAWADAPLWQRMSAIQGVRHILAHPETTPEQSHQNWLLAKMEDGWVYGPVKNPETKQHPCMVAYALLPLEQRTKDHLFGAAVRSSLA